MKKIFLIFLFTFILNVNADAYEDICGNVKDVLENKYPCDTGPRLQELLDNPFFDYLPKPHNMTYDQYRSLIKSKIKKWNDSAKQISSNSKDVTLSCSSQKGLKASIIINENSNKIIFNGFRVKTKIQWGTKVKFKHPDPNKFNPKLSNHNEVVLDRVTGELTFPLSSSDFDHIFTKIFICKKSQALF